MDKRRKQFLQALVNCGVSIGPLIAVGTVIKTEASMMLMAERILAAEDRGEKITDELVLQILVDLMKEASVETEE